MILHGENVILKADGVAIAAAKSCEVTINVDTDEIASSADGKWKQFIVGRKSWRATCSHLVTDILNPAQMVGVDVTLTINIANIGLPIKYFFLTSPTIELQSAVSVDYVVWDGQAKRFLGCKEQSVFNRKYYINWLDKEIYTEAPIGSKFRLTSTNETYTLTASGLVADKLSGTAIVKEWKLTAARGNLAQGSFRFEGVGPLE